MDANKISIFTTIICTLEGLCFGFFYRELTKYQKQEFILSTCLIGIPFFVISKIDYNIFGKWLTFQSLILFSGAFLPNLGKYGSYIYILLYIAYYVLMFNIGVSVSSKVNKKKFQY